MSGIPGSPQIQNIIPTKYYGTTAMAAPIMALAAGARYGRWRRSLDEIS